MNTSVPEISVVVPVYNEADSLQELHRRLTAALEAFGRAFEVVVVDDGSTDESWGLLQEMHAADSRVKVLRFSRNFGQTPAIFAGFAQSKGNIVVTLDADLQNFPEDIPKLVVKLEEGYDVVNGWRVSRQDPFFRRLSSRLLNQIVSRVTRTEIRDYGCALKAFRREVVDRLLSLRHRSRYLLVEAVKLGVRVAEIEVSHQERPQGESKYGFFDLLRVNLDIMTGITAAPLRAIGVLGWLVAMGGFAMAVKVVYFRLTHGIVNFMETVTALFFVIAGVQLVATGLMCEYLSRILVEVQGRPYYVVQEVLE